jgi:hypothetical protein
MITRTVHRSLSQHLQDHGVRFEDLQQDLATYLGKTLNETAGIIVQAWLECELDMLIYESGIWD